MINQEKKMRDLEVALQDATKELEAKRKLYKVELQILEDEVAYLLKAIQLTNQISNLKSRVTGFTPDVRLANIKIEDIKTPVVNVPKENVAKEQKARQEEKKVDAMSESTIGDVRKEIESKGAANPPTANPINNAQQQRHQQPKVDANRPGRVKASFAQMNTTAPTNDLPVESFGASKQNKDIQSEIALTTSKIDRPTKEEAAKISVADAKVSSNAAVVTAKPMIVVSYNKSNGLSGLWEISSTGERTRFEHIDFKQYSSLNLAHRGMSLNKDFLKILKSAEYSNHIFCLNNDAQAILGNNPLLKKILPTREFDSLGTDPGYKKEAAN